jgi:hypothetical protein
MKLTPPKRALKFKKIISIPVNGISLLRLSSE